MRETSVLNKKKRRIKTKLDVLNDSITSLTILYVFEREFSKQKVKVNDNLLNAINGTNHA